LIGSLTAFGILLGVASGGAFAQTPHDEHHTKQTEQPREFQRIDQPLWLKGAVTAGELGLIGLELWWFLLSKPKSRKASTQGDVQKITLPLMEDWVTDHLRQTPTKTDAAISSTFELPSS
jgi:plastocyanin domain-containing protein